MDVFNTSNLFTKYNTWKISILFQNVELNINLIIFNLIISILLFLFGYLKFIKVEKNFIDTV